MNWILLHITSFIYIILLAMFYFRKTHISNIENKIYKNLLISNILGLVIEFCCFFAVPNASNMPLFTFVVTKLLLMYYVYFLTIYTIYVFVICRKTEKNSVGELNTFFSKISMRCFSVMAVLIALIAALPIEYYYDGINIYTYGSSVDFLQVIFVAVMSIWCYVLIKNYKNIKIHKYLPVITFVMLALIAGVIQKFYPQILLTTPIETLVIFLMYHTIENPDMKLLDELHKSKEISDSANEEKMMFLYNISQEIRKSTDIVDDYANLILESNDSDEIKNSARNIKIETTKFNSLMNEMFDVSKIDSSNIKVYNSKYSVKNILKEIITIYNNKCGKKMLEFRVNVDHNVPELLYGDSINLKKALMIILDNSLEYTDSGYVEFNVNTVIKNDVCRLIISVEDSGSGIKGEDINGIKINSKSFSEANKLITLMSGAINISSNYGYGTKVKIILDQKIELIENEDVIKYESLYDNIKLLMVDDSEAGIKIIDKIIKGTNINMDFAMNGKECIDKIKIGNYDLILLDEQLTQISAMELIKKINGIKNFDIPIVLLTKDNSFEYNDEYKNMGFSDYILKPVKKKDLLDVIDKCIKKDK